MQENPHKIEKYLVTKTLKSNKNWLNNCAIADDYLKVLNDCLINRVILADEIHTNLHRTVMERRVAITCWVRYNCGKIIKPKIAERIYEQEKNSNEYNRVSAKV